MPCERGITNFISCGLLSKGGERNVKEYFGSGAGDQCCCADFRCLFGGFRQKGRGRNGAHAGNRGCDPGGRERISRLEPLGLFPLPDRSYTKRYSLYRRMLNSGIGQRLLIVAPQFGRFAV